MLTASGAKLLDFGLAKPQAFATGPEAATLSAELTRDNSLIGTLNYMAPEQLKGRPADIRSDLFALGVVLYEMASGRKAFEGESHAEVIASIVGGEMPPLEAVIPAELRHVVKTCLAKDPDTRWQNARDLVLRLGWIKSSPGAQSMPVSRSTRPYLWFAAAVVVLSAIVITVLLWPRPTPAGPLYRFQMYPPEKSSFHSFALSPDGRRLAFSAITAGRRALWLRDLDSVTPRLLAGTEDAYNPFWAPDGRSIAFFTLGALKKVDVSLPSGNTPPQTLFVGDTHSSASGAGLIVFSPSANFGVFQIPETGGSRSPLTTLDQSRQEVLHWLPQFLPGGERFLFAAISVAEGSTSIYSGTLHDKRTQHVLNADSARYVRSDGRDYLLFNRGDALAAQAFDNGRLQLKGDPYVITERAGAYSVSTGEVLAYSDPAKITMRLSWLDRQGRTTEAHPSITYPNDIKISPDGRRVAVIQRNDFSSGTGDVWITDLIRGGAPARLTFRSDKPHGCLVWSADGSSLVYHSNADGTFNLYIRAANGAGGEAGLLPPGQGRCATSWSRDGRFLIFQEYDANNKQHIWILPMKGDRKPVPFMRTDFREVQAQLSPDGQWIAYTSDESGQREVYVRPFRGGPATDSDGKWLISAHGGHSPLWRPDGKELFYIAADRNLMATEIKPGAAFQTGQTRALFELNSWATSSNFVYRYDISPDGQRFLVDDRIEEGSASPITVMLNWTSLLTKQASR
jgi:Tol biopolymer transport system component